MTILQTVQARRAALLSHIENLEARLKEAPDGILIAYRNGSHYKYFQQISSKGSSGKKERHYIPAGQRQFAEQLASKTCDWYDLLDSKEELKTIEQFLQSSQSRIQRKEKHLAQRTSLRNLIQPGKTNDEELQEWQNASYEKNPGHPEHLTVKTIRGEYVRSKSESIIALVLSNHLVPYRYECALPLPSATLYPDFMIMHPVSRQIFLWEHFGMIDNPRYLRNQFEYKIELYVQYGYIPGQNLILTFESSERGIDAQYADLLVKYYFE